MRRLLRSTHAAVLFAAGGRQGLHSTTQAAGYSVCSSVPPQTSLLLSHSVQLGRIGCVSHGISPQVAAKHISCTSAVQRIHISLYCGMLCRALLLTLPVWVTGCPHAPLHSPDALRHGLKLGAHLELPQKAVAAACAQLGIITSLRPSWVPPYLPQGLFESESVLQRDGPRDMYADSVQRKRKTKMNKHKHRKRLKKMRHGKR